MPPDVKGRPPAENWKGGPDADAHASEIDNPMLPRRALPHAASAPPGQLPLRWSHEVEDLPPNLAARIRLGLASVCWLWIGTIDNDGYGKVGGRGAHRVIWEALVGPVPPGMVLDHREDWGCTSRACCNPAHLLAVLPVVNVLRGDSPPARNARKTQCDSGHEFSAANTYIRPGTGHRDCRRCIADRARHYRARQRERAERERQGPGLATAA
jgi:hypothetical protein